MNQGGLGNEPTGLLLIREEIHDDFSLSGMGGGFVFVLVSAPQGALSYQLEAPRIEL